jgi:hypothetical protein
LAGLYAGTSDARTQKGFAISPLLKGRV